MRAGAVMRVRAERAVVFAAALVVGAVGCRDRGESAAGAGPPASPPAAVDATRAPAEVAPALPSAMVAAIDAVMAPVAGDDRPGCAVGVVQRGAIVLARGYGLADLARGVPITADTVFDLGSTSKQVTAAAVLQLVAEGEISLDDPVRRYIPELATRRGRPIRVRDLLHHTSGLPDYVDLLQDAGHDLGDVTTTQDALAALARARPLAAPGVEHDYSNSNYFLLGEIVARAAGTSLAAYAADHLFAPLGMTSTRVADGVRWPAAMAWGHDVDDDGAWVPVRSGWRQVGDGAVLSTVGDLARWARLFDAPETTALPGAAALVAAMLAPGALDDGTALAYAGGLEHDVHAGRAIVSHAGSWLGFGAELVRFPAERTSVICLCNFDDSDPTALALAVADVVLDGR